MEEHIYNVEELHRGKWQPLITDNGKQKFAKITDEEADIMNGQTQYSDLRYVKEDSKDDEVDLKELRVEYEEVVGKKPHHNAGEEKMREDIANAKKQ